jgi:hypothetical protein
MLAFQTLPTALTHWSDALLLRAIARAGQMQLRKGSQFGLAQPVDVRRLSKRIPDKLEVGEQYCCVRDARPSPIALSAARFSSCVQGCTPHGIHGITPSFV